MFKRHVLAASLALAAGSVAAAPLVFDPTGTDSTTGSFTVDRLDFDPSGVLAIGGNQAVANFLNRTGSTAFQVVTQMTLAGGSLNNVGVFSTTLAPYEITAVLGFGERVIAATTGNGITTSGSADFQYDATQPSFIRLYYDTLAATRANQLLGTGFNDGRLIFSSNVSTVGGFFSTQITPATDTFDKSGNGNQWNGQTTVTGAGVNTTLTVDVGAPGFIDTTFFRNAPLLQFLIENVSLNVPFTTTDPSYQFTTVANTLYTVTADGGMTSTLGPKNGGLNCSTGVCIASGPDFQFQTDVNSSIQGTVPEPSTLALVGLALAGVGFGAMRRRS